jgi:DNA-directed RNA polymerase subunit RPC12/RpoP
MVTNNMILKTAKCTVCGASLKLDVNKDLVNCTYCKSQIIVSNALDFAKVELDRSKDIVKLRDNLIKFVNSKIMNQLSYKVSNQKIKKIGFMPKGNLKKEILDTLKIFNLVKN